jgi:dipeptidyl aminopeptidase/acylaminoacyl peptidase
MPRSLRVPASLLCLCLLSQSPGVSANDLIERFAIGPSTSTAKVSLDGKYVALGCMRREAPAACVYELDNAGKPPIVVLPPSEHLLDYFTWLDHGWLMMRVRMPVYNRDRHRWVSQLNDTVTNIRTQQTRSLGANSLLSIPSEPVGVIVVGTDGGSARVDLASGEVKHQPFDPAFLRGLLFAWFDDRGERVLALRMDRDQKKLFVVRGANGAEVPLDAAMTTTYPYDPMFLGFTEGGAKLASLGYLGGDRLQLQLFDSASGKRLPQDPALAALRFEEGIRDLASEELVGLSYADDMPHQKFLDTKLDRIHATVAKALPGMNVELVSWSRDRSVVTVGAGSPGKPPAFYLFDRKQGSLSPLGSADLSDLPATRTTAVEYTARDGLKIVALLTLPADKQAQSPLPLILMPHDGPYKRDYAGYDWWVEYLAQRGYAVLRPNYRGSSGYGKTFVEKGYGEFGGAMIDDIIDGARFVTASGLVDRNRVCAAGIGYGGYAALMTGIREPALINCIVAINPISDAVTVLGEHQKFYSRRSAIYQYWENYLGGRYHDDAAAAAISPARSASQIRPPVLLLHDTRHSGAPVTQSRYLKERMDLYERDAKLIEFETGDPALATAKSRRVVLTESDAFLAKYLNKK